MAEASTDLARLDGAPDIANPGKVTPHSLRHTFVNLAHEAGAPL